jgi:hypothetical protein
MIDFTNLQLLKIDDTINHSPQQRRIRRFEKETDCFSEQSGNLAGVLWH